MIGILVITLSTFVSTIASCLCPGSPGDLIVLTRLNGFYHHYAINVGNGYIVHMTGSKDDVVQCFKSIFLIRRCEKAEVKKEKCADVAKPGSRVQIEHGPWKDKLPLSVNEIIDRALSKVGTSGYHVLYNNCEHFARWCRYGEEGSKQADNMMLALLIAELLVGTFLLFVMLLLVYLFAESFLILIMALLFRAIYLYLCASCEVISEILRHFTRDTDFKKLEKIQLLCKDPRPGAWLFPPGTIFADIILIHEKERHLLRKELERSYA